MRLYLRPLLAGLTAASIALSPVAGFAQAPAAQPQRKQLLEYPSIHHPVVGTRGMVVSQNEIATEVGAQILRKGGNAVDAAVAVGFALAVTLPRAGNIGGDGFMLVHIAQTKETLVIDFRSVAPKSARLEMFVDAKGQETQVASRGYKASAVPGTVAGLALAHRKYGKLAWKDVVEPAFQLASKGVVLSPDEAFVFSWAQERMTESRAGTRTFYKPDGELYKAGETLKQPDLAWSLRQIADHGADAFYKGEIAKRFAADMKAHGGLITLEDLASYRAVERKPLMGEYRGLQVATTPPASAGGATLLQMLNMLEGFDLKALGGAGSAGSLNVMAQAMKIAYADRYRHLGDTDFVKVPLKGFTSKAYAAERAKLISTERAVPAKELTVGDPWAYESPNTTHYSVADADGNAVSTTYTLGADFGSGVMVEGTGFVLNNQMNNYSHEQAVAAREKGEGLPPNAMEPGKRMLSTMMPTIVFKDGKPWLITGTPGGSTIIDTVLQVIVNVVDFKLNVAEATHQPRIFQDARDGMDVEPNFNPDTIALLQAKGHKVRVNETMGSAQSIMIDKGLFLGAADPRRPGATAVAP